MSSPPRRHWADAWLAALAAFSHPGRMRRGQQFFARGRIRRLAVESGHMSAIVREGSQGFQVDLQLEVLADTVWEQIVSRLATQAIYSARLLNGEMPPEVVEVFAEIGAPLFPEARTLQARCTCPDWEVPCKHVAALYYYLADRFEEDPFLLFNVRGRGKEQFLAALRLSVSASLANNQQPIANPQSASLPPLQPPNLDLFWDMDPQAESLRFHIVPPAAPLPQLRRLGPPSFTQLDLVALLAPIYETVTQKAIAWAMQGPEQTS